MDSKLQQNQNKYLITFFVNIGKYSLLEDDIISEIVYGENEKEVKDKIIKKYNKDGKVVNRIFKIKLLN